MSTSPSLFDSSVWLALAFDKHPHHGEANRAFAAASSIHPIAFCRSTQQSYLRLVTTPAIQTRYRIHPIRNTDAWAKFEQMLALPQIIWLDEPIGLNAHWQKYSSLATPSPKVWMDSYLAAFARTRDIPLITLDKDFKQFPGLRLRFLS